MVHESSWTIGAQTAIAFLSNVAPVASNCSQPRMFLLVPGHPDLDRQTQGQIAGSTEATSESKILPIRTVTPRDSWIQDEESGSERHIHSMVTEIGPWFPWFFSSQKIVKYANVMPPEGTGCLVSCRVWISVDEGPKVGRGLGCEPLRMACRSCWWHGPKPTRNGVMKRGEIPQEWRL